MVLQPLFLMNYQVFGDSDQRISFLCIVLVYFFRKWQIHMVWPVWLSWESYKYENMGHIWHVQGNVETYQLFRYQQIWGIGKDTVAKMNNKYWGDTVKKACTWAFRAHPHPSANAGSQALKKYQWLLLWYKDSFVCICNRGKCIHWQLKEKILLSLSFIVHVWLLFFHVLQLSSLTTLGKNKVTIYDFIIKSQFMTSVLKTLAPQYLWASDMQGDSLE